MMTTRTNNLLSNNYAWSIRNRPESMGSGISGLGVRRDIPHEFINFASDLLVCIARIGKPWNLTIVSIYVPQSVSSDALTSKLTDIV